MRIKVKKPISTMFGSLAPGTVLEMPEGDRVGMWMLEHPLFATRENAVVEEEPAPEPELEVRGAKAVLMELDGNSEIVVSGDAQIEEGNGDGDKPAKRRGGRAAKRSEDSV